MSLTFNMIGTGKLGKTLAHLLVKSKTLTIKGIFNRKFKTSQKTLEFIGKGSIYTDILKLPSADLTFITTPDDAIADQAIQLCHNKNIKPGSIVLHCSGLLSSDILAPLKEQTDCYIASIHPMHSFAKPDLSLKTFAGTFCAFEGDEKALATISQIFLSIGAVPYSIPKEKKALYHAAGVFASNYLITLAEEAVSCLQELGVEDGMAVEIICNLMQASITNLQRTKVPKEALTGPLQRGDVTTIAKHLEALQDNILQKELYKALGKATLALTEHSEEKRAALQELLNQQ